MSECPALARLACIASPWSSTSPPAPLLSPLQHAYFEEHFCMNTNCDFYTLKTNKMRCGVKIDWEELGFLRWQVVMAKHLVKSSCWSPAQPLHKLSNAKVSERSDTRYQLQGKRKETRQQWVPWRADEHWGANTGSKCCVSAGRGPCLPRAGAGGDVKAGSVVIVVL